MFFVYPFIFFIIFNTQPKDKSTDIKTFLIYLRGDTKTNVKPIAKSKSLWFNIYFLFITLNTEIIIKTKGDTTKFKLRCSRYLYTANVSNLEKADKIKSAIPNTIQKVELGDKKRGKVEKEATGKKTKK